MRSNKLLLTMVKLLRYFSNKLTKMAVKKNGSGNFPGNNKEQNQAIVDRVD